MNKAIEDIAAERQRQKTVEGWTFVHDDKHNKGEMATAAGIYCLHGMGSIAPWHRPSMWPWDWSWWKPKDRRRDLIRAAALIVAEIERLDRSEGGKEYETFTRDGAGVCRALKEKP